MAVHSIEKNGAGRGRRQFEKTVLTEMVGLFCRKHHDSRSLCPDCAELVQYAGQRLDACRFGDEKTFCSACTVHCYRPDRRAQVRQVMRYAGPRMLLHHPIMTIRHMLLKK